MVAPILVISGPSGAGKTTVGRLLATSFDMSVHIQSDAFMPFVVSGWAEPWLPESAHQNHVLGGAAASAAISFAEGGYTVIFDGPMFPDGVKGFGRMCARRGVPLNCAVLRPELATCLARARGRSPEKTENLAGRPEHAGWFDPALLTDQYDRFRDFSPFESHVVDGSGGPEEVAATVLAAFRAGTLGVPAG